MECTVVWRKEKYAVLEYSLELFILYFRILKILGLEI